MIFLWLLLAVDPQKTIALEGETFRVQGIVVEDQRLYVTSVDRKARKGYLFEYELPSGKRLRQVEIQDGNDRFHPGGFDADKTSFWIPVAEYKRSSTAVIQKRNRKTFALEASFPVDDHIGCVAVAGNRLYGGNWDARQIFEWSHEGKLIRKRDNPSNIHYQDCKFRDGKIIGAGTDSKAGAVEVIDPATLKLIRRTEYGRTPDRNTLYTHEGMDIFKGKLYLLPEDAPSRLFVFPLP